MRTLALVPARAGSRGIPHKNTRDFCGKPLMAWAIEVGLKTCDMTVVSTDGERAAEIAVDYGATLRLVGPPLHTDECPMLDVMQDTARAVDDWDVMVLLQPTAPLRTPGHVRAALKLLEETGADSVVSVVEFPRHYCPGWALYMLPDGTLDGRAIDAFMPSRRQNLKQAYTRDGTVYVTRRGVLERGSIYGVHCVPLIMKPEHSVTIDTQEDWDKAEAMRERVHA